MSTCKTICIYHGNCADGFGAAWAVRQSGVDADFVPGVYQTDPPDVTGARVIMVDFSYRRPVMEELGKKAQSILVLDHHKSAAEDLAEYPEPPCDISELRGWLPYSGIYARFDMERSCAILAWEHFHTGDPPQLLRHVEDRDLWRFALPGTREIQAAVFSYPYDFDVWACLMGTPLDDLRREGEAIERKHHKDIAELVKVCQRYMNIGGYSMPVASLPYTLTSDAGRLMAINDDSQIAACYWDTAEARVFSLRSPDGGPDVSGIAKLYGGGGHAHAAGFAVPRGHALAQE